MKIKKAFTLAEAILTMTILGIIAATMVTTLKPSQYKQQGFDTLKKKIYAEIDGVTNTFTVECAQKMQTLSVYNDCDRSKTTHAFGTLDNVIYANYMRGTTGAVSTDNGICPALTNYTSLRLKNGACIYFGTSTIKVDVNGNQKPDEIGSDRMILTITNDGISQDVDTAQLKNAKIQYLLC